MKHPSTEMLDEMAYVLEHTNVILKKLIEDNKMLQVKADVVDLMSCFLFAKVPEAKSLGYGEDPVWRIENLVSRYRNYKKETEAIRQNRKSKVKTTVTEVKDNDKVKSSRKSRSAGVVR